MFTMRKISLLILLLPFTALSQKNIELKSSMELISEGLKLHSEKSYYDAISRYRKISVNDTNYSIAQYEMALSYVKLEEYTLAEKTLKNLIDLEISHPTRAMSYVLMGQTQDGLKKTDEALKTYATALALYPMNYSLYYARAITNDNAGNRQASMEDYKRAAQCNMGNATIHLRLGMIAANEGRYTESILSLMTFLIIEPDSDRSNSVVGILEQISNGSYTPESKNIILSEKGDDFEDLNLFIINKVALQDKYKAKFTIPTSYAKQLHLILSSVKYDKNDEGFWHQTYLPLFLDFYNSGKLDDLILFSLSSVTNPDVQKKLKSAKKRLTDFHTIGAEKWRTNTAKQYMEFEGTKQHVYVAYEGKGISSIGKMKDEKTFYGNLYKYYPDGAKEVKIPLDENGKANGMWLKYDNFTQKLVQEMPYVNDEISGLAKYYYPTGELSETRNYVKGLIQDTVYYFFRSGDVKEKLSFKDGKRNGLSTAYYSNGKVQSTVDYKNGNAEGIYRVYYPNGQLSDEVQLTANKLSGKRVAFYSDGKKKNEYEFNAASKAVGPYKKWFPNGQLQEEGSYVDGKEVGTHKTYYSNGQLYQTTVFDETGKENGTSVYYDSEGRKYEEIILKKGNIEEMILYNSKGEVVEKTTRNGKKMSYKSHYSDGSVSNEGLLLNDQKNGIWKTYDQYGNVKFVEKFVNDVNTDTLYAYHPNGKNYYSYVYKDGLLNGLYLEYDIFGNLIKESTYKEDELSNDSYIYYKDGNLNSESCFKAGEYTGLQKEYAINGKLNRYDVYNDGRIDATVILDTASTEMQRFGEMHGMIVFRDPGNTYDLIKANYKNGDRDGETVHYSPEGKVILRGNYIAGRADGLFQWYYDNGNLKKAVNYRLGKIDGDYKSYFDNGKVSYHGNYVNGLAQGVIKYFNEEGKLTYEANYLDDKRHGKMTSFAPDGSVQQFRYYDKGIILAYSYLDKSGKEVTPIKVGKGENHIVTYYQSGGKSVDQTRINGNLIGLYTEFYPSGKISETINYREGERDGADIEYYENGQVKREQMYKMGNLYGTSKEYYPNGKLKVTTEYVNDDLHGKSMRYNEAGKLIKTTLYYNDEIIKVTNH